MIKRNMKQAVLLLAMAALPAAEAMAQSHVVFDLGTPGMRTYWGYPYSYSYGMRYDPYWSYKSSYFPETYGGDGSYYGLGYSGYGGNGWYGNYWYW